MPGFHFNEMGELVLSAVEDVSVVDVYDLASDIGKECEKIIDLFGADSVTSLMPKVINALEMLEAMASRNERENSVVQELNDRITQLESEKIEKAIFRERFQKEIETIEEQWRTESSELVAMVNRLQEENRRIQKDQTGEGDVQEATKKTANNITSTHLINESSTNLSSSPTDLQMLQRMRAQLDKTRNELKQKDNCLEEKRAEIENLHMQLDRLKVSSREIRKRQKLFQMQVRTLCEERADFLAQLQDQHREILALRKNLGIAEKENEDLSLESLEDDPNRPRYTTAELKDLINERDTLKSKIVDLEELMGQTEVEDDKAGDTKQPTKLEEQLPEDDPPVQGPLPFEPDDAPWKKTDETGIRKFFRKLFSEQGSAGFPRRSLSTLSKMALSTGTGDISI